MTLERCKQEIVELHEFFEAWLSGRMPATEKNFSRLEEALGQGFTIITPSAEKLGRDAILELVRNGHGSRPDLEIRIENVVIVNEIDDVVIATYEEWQKESGSRVGRVGAERASHATQGREQASHATQAQKGRLSSVVFHADAAQPTWLHVHECWLDR